MENVEKLIKENGTIIRVKGRMDSGNVSAIEEAIGEVKEPVVIDLDELEYTSSAGLRLILKIKKAHPDTKVINARSEVYEVFEMTGFTEMMEIHKAYRKVSVEGCQVIGKGANGIVYRLDPDTVVKVYLNDDSLDVIQHEREVAKLAFVLGIPTAMSYDVVKVDNHYASMFEMIDAKSFATLLGEPDVDIDKLAKEYASLVKLIHSTHVPDHQLPSKKEAELKCVENIKDRLPEDAYKKLLKFFCSLEDSDTMLHCDLHIKNLMMTEDGIMLIDMDTLAVGDPIFEWASVWSAYVGYGIADPKNAEKFFEAPGEAINKFYKRSLAYYWGSEDEAFLNKKEEEASIVALPHIIDHYIRHHKTLESELSIKKLIALLDEVE